MQPRSLSAAVAQLVLTSPMRWPYAVVAATFYCVASAVFFDGHYLAAIAGAGGGAFHLVLRVLAFLLQPWLFVLSLLLVDVTHWLPSRSLSTVALLHTISFVLLVIVLLKLRRFRFVYQVVISIAIAASVPLIVVGIRDYRFGSSMLEPGPVHTRPVEDEPDYIKKLKEWDVKKP